MLKYAYSLNIVHNLTFKKKEICWWVCCVNFGNCIMDTQESCLDSVKNKMLGNEVEEWIAFDIYIWEMLYPQHFYNKSSVTCCY